MKLLAPLLTALCLVSSPAVAQICEDYLKRRPTVWILTPAGLQYQIDRYKQLPREQALDKLIDLYFEIEKASKGLIAIEKKAEQIYFDEYSFAQRINPRNRGRIIADVSLRELDRQIDDLLYYEEYTGSLVWKIAKMKNTNDQPMSFEWFDRRWGYPRYKFKGHPAGPGSANDNYPDWMRNSY